MKKLRTPPGRLHQLKPRTPTGRLASLLPTTTTPQSTHIIHHIPNSFFLTFQFQFPIDRIASRDIPHFSGAVTPPSSPVCSAKLHQTVPHISHSQLQFYYIRIPDCAAPPLGVGACACAVILLQLRRRQEPNRRVMELASSLKCACLSCNKQKSISLLLAHPARHYKDLSCEPKWRPKIKDERR